MTYVHLLLAFAAAVAFLLVQLLLQKRRQPRPSRLYSLVNQSSSADGQLYHDYLVPLLVYEENYPSFMNILGTVLTKFPLEYFLQEENFKSGLVNLRNGVFHSSNEQTISQTMSLIVNVFLSDPDVEYRCRRRLKPLIRQFLKEIDTKRLTTDH